MDLLSRVRPEIYRRLDIDFYEPRMKTLTPEKSEGNVNVLVGRLAEQGVIYRQRKGEYEFTAPKFHEFLRRRQAE
jgi:hypothetical protein